MRTIEQKVKHNEQLRKYYAEDLDKARKSGRERQSTFYKAHPAVAIAANARYKANKLGLLCTCCTIEDFRLPYALGRKLRMELDHIKRHEIGGLHCVHNLQLLTRLEHQRKSRLERRGLEWQPGTST